MLRAGLEHVMEPDTLEDKKPSFDSNDSFHFSVFGVPFDFVLARSIWTHANIEQAVEAQMTAQGDSRADV